LALAKDDTGSTPLHYAVSVKNMDAVELLLKKDKTSAYIADSYGLFPVHVAANLGFLDVIARLLELCPDSDQLVDAQGKSFFHIAVKEKKVHLVRWVCNNSKLTRVMNAKDFEGNTPMHLAVKTGHLKTFAVLLKSKMVDTGVMNKRGLTPLDLAAAQKRTGPFNWQVTRFVFIILFL
jgi:ankyrin repeat protein